MKTAFWMMVLILFSGVTFAQTMAVYPVKSEGFSMNGSDVSEMSRLASQACTDAGFRCAFRGSSNYLQEGGRKVNADYVVEFVLTGKTGDKFNVGSKKGGFGVGSFMAKKTPLGYTGVGSAMKLSGIRVGAGSMVITGQFVDKDGFIACTKTKSKLGMKGELILAEGKSDNAKKLLKGFQDIF